MQLSCRFPSFEARYVDPIRNDDDSIWIIPVGDQPIANGIRIHCDPVCKFAHPSLDAALRRRKVRTHIANGCDHARSGKPGRRYGKDVGVEVIGVNDVNSELANVAREAKLSTERLRMLECANAVIKNPDTLRLELIEEAAGSSEAPEADFEV